MSYQSTVYRVLIASPSDVEEEREIMSRIIQDWNDLNSFNKKIVILPVKWETHSAPTFGVRPQEVINRQIVDECDLLIGFFWTRVGSPTGEELSGTIEEIKRVSNAGKPVMLYFSKRGKDPSLIDLKQLELLNKFKNEVYPIALVENFSSLIEFKDKVSRQLEMKIRELQSKHEIAEDILALSLIDISTGNLLSKAIGVNHERVLNKESLITEAAERLNYSNKYPWPLQNATKSFFDKKNNLPVIFGIKNNVNRFFQDIIIEIELSSSLGNELIVASSNEDDYDIIDNTIDRFLSDENKDKLRKLISDDIIQVSNNVWALQLKPFSLRPNEIKILKPFIFLDPNESMKIDIRMTLLSENFLSPLETTNSISINVEKREISTDEAYEIIKRAEEDDLPF